MEPIKPVKHVFSLRVTLRRVNEALAAQGAAERLERGKDYFYFIEGDAPSWPSTMVAVPRLGSLSVEGWINEWRTLRAAYISSKGA